MEETGMEREGLESRGIDACWDLYTDSEKSLFQRVCRRLLKSTFIVRDKDEEHRREYFFASRNPDPLNAFFGYIGMQVVVEREYGVIMLKNGADSGEGARFQIGHAMLTKLESIVLLCLWTIYSDRISAGRLTRSVLVSMPELRFEMEKYGVQDLNEKTQMAECFATLAGYHLLDRVGRLGDEDFRLRLYPSLLFCLDLPAFRALTAAASKRMQEGREELEEMGRTGEEIPDEENVDDDDMDVTEENGDDADTEQA